MTSHYRVWNSTGQKKHWQFEMEFSVVQVEIRAWWQKRTSAKSNTFY